MALVEIYPNNRSGRRYSEDYFKRHSDYNSCCEWFEEGNEIVVILNTETNTEAVYERLGGILCLDERFGIYCNVDVDDDWTGHNELIRKMLVQEATSVGFPEECPTPNPYIAHMRIPISVWFKASDVDEANEVARKLMDRITNWTRGWAKDELVDDIMSNLLDTELIELADDSKDNGVADYTLSESDVERIIG